MELATPVTVTIAGVTTTFSSLAPVIIDDAAHKIVVARLHPALRPFPLWRGSEYDAAGDWTQAQADARIMELLGSDVQAGLQALVSE